MKSTCICTVCSLLLNFPHMCKNISTNERGDHWSAHGITTNVIEYFYHCDRKVLQLVLPAYLIHEIISPTFVFSAQICFRFGAEDLHRLL